MPAYKLTYFNGRGRAEVSRWLFALAGVKYEDYRLAEGEWPKIKSTTQLGFLPLLEVDGKQISQSLTIVRYLAREFGLLGKTPLEQARVDMILTTVDDLFSEMVKIHFTKDKTAQAEAMKKFQGEQLPTTFGNLEKLVESKYFVGDSITAADLALAFFLDCLVEIKYDSAKTPKLCAIKKGVLENSKIKAWIEKRPKTSF